MKKATFILLLIPALIFAVSLAGPLEQAAYAAPAGHMGGGSVGRAGGGSVGRAGGGHVGRFEGRGFGGHEHFEHGGHFRGSIWIGPGWGWWDPFYYPYYPYPYYTPPTVVVPEESPEYIAPAPQPEESGYWYYCKDSKSYYPYVKSCPSGWMKVVPSPMPPDQD